MVESKAQKEYDTVQFRHLSSECNIRVCLFVCLFSVYVSVHRELGGGWGVVTCYQHGCICW